MVVTHNESIGTDRPSLAENRFKSSSSVTWNNVSHVNYLEIALTVGEMTLKYYNLVFVAPSGNLLLIHWFELSLLRTTEFQHKLQVI